MFEKVQIEFLIDASRNDVGDVLHQLERFLVNKRLTASQVNANLGTVVSLKEAVKSWGVDPDFKPAED